eukprot:scaffold115563_cov19-Tisochrysis_lutea.AAC.1
MAFRQLLVSAKPAICGAMGVGAGMAFPQAVLADKKGDKDPGRPMFDPEALERGAAALREINKSPYAKQTGVTSVLQQLALSLQLSSSHHAAHTSAQSNPIGDQKLH